MIHLLTLFGVKGNRPRFLAIYFSFAGGKAHLGGSGLKQLQAMELLTLQAGR